MGCLNHEKGNVKYQPIIVNEPHSFCAGMIDNIKKGLKNGIKSKNNDINALRELDLSLRKFDAIDPVKYDFALFGLGRYESF